MSFNHTISDAFIEYLQQLFGILFNTKNEFLTIYDNRGKNFPKAVKFSIFSLLMSISFVFLLKAIGLFSYKEETDVFLKSFAIIPLQLLIIVPLITIFLHVPLFVLGGKGKIK